MRIFVAVWPPPDVVALVRALPRPSAAATRWTDEATWHVTLRFLGNLDPGDVDTVATRLAAVAPHATAVAGPATELLRRNVLSVPVAGLEALAAAVVATTADIGEPPDPRPFRGHLTIARARGRARLAPELAGGAINAAWAVDEIAVVRSVLSSDGPRYETLLRLS